MECIKRDLFNLAAYCFVYPNALYLSSHVVSFLFLSVEVLERTVSFLSFVL
jgi:hypothetical protein